MFFSSAGTTTTEQQRTCCKFSDSRSIIIVYYLNIEWHLRVLCIIVKRLSKQQKMYIRTTKQHSERRKKAKRLKGAKHSANNLRS